MAKKIKKTKNNEEDHRILEFCKNVALTDNAYQSAIKAGYSKSYAKSDSSRLREKYCKEIESLKSIVKKTLAEELGYSVIESFNKLKEIQELALKQDDKGNYSNLSPAIKAEELIGKIAGFYVEKKEISTSDNGFCIKVVSE